MNNNRPSLDELASEAHDGDVTSIVDAISAAVRDDPTLLRDWFPDAFESTDAGWSFMGLWGGWLLRNSVVRIEREGVS